MNESTAKKHIPERKCIGCREHFPKSSLIRAIRTPEGEITLDKTGKKNGRGAYICKSVECLRRARKQGALERALECNIGDEIYELLEGAITE